MDLREVSLWWKTIFNAVVMISNWVCVFVWLHGCQDASIVVKRSSHTLTYSLTHLYTDSRLPLSLPLLHYLGLLYLRRVPCWNHLPCHISHLWQTNQTFVLGGCEFWLQLAATLSPLTPIWAISLTRWQPILRSTYDDARWWSSRRNLVGPLSLCLCPIPNQIGFPSCQSFLLSRSPLDACASPTR